MTFSYNSVWMKLSLIGFYVERKTGNKTNVPNCVSILQTVKIYPIHTQDITRLQRSCDQKGAKLNKQGSLLTILVHQNDVARLRQRSERVKNTAVTQK